MSAIDLHELARELAPLIAEYVPPPPLLTADQAGELLNVPATWLLAQARAGRVPHCKLGHYVRFDAGELDEWRRARTGWTEGGTVSRSNSPKRRRSTKESINSRSPAASGYCEATGKLKYSSKSRAKDELKRINREQSRKANRQVQTRAYLCGKCGCWHTTTQAKEVSEGFAERARARRERREQREADG